MTGPDGNRPNRVAEVKSSRDHAKTFCLLGLILSLLIMIASLYDMLAPSAANEILEMPSINYQVPFYLVLRSALIDIGLMALPGGVMLLYPKWKQYAPPIIPFNGYRDKKNFKKDLWNPITIHWICPLLVSFLGDHVGLFPTYVTLVLLATCLVAMRFFWITYRNLSKDHGTMDTLGEADTTS